jgi:undecaprenyl phosphate N,N'-diacetylbacillosamine 1-phosphate transferase
MAAHSFVATVKRAYSPFPANMTISEHAVPTARPSSVFLECFGRVVAAILCILGIPIHLCLSALIYVTDKGPILFRADRLGKWGIHFKLLKYRTLKVNSAPIVTADFKTVVIDRDPRVTSMGRWLRCGVDELPQLVNIIKGEMTWIGPRPDDDWMLPHYGDVTRLRLTAKPGITGLAQVLNSRYLSTAEGYAIDIWYIVNRSVWMDIAIVLITPLFMGGLRDVGAKYLCRLRTTVAFSELVKKCDAEIAEAAAHPHWPEEAVTTEYSL